MAEPAKYGIGTCADCNVFDPQLEGRGLCRKRPPFYIDPGLWIWPVCRTVDWCGDWTAIPAAEPPP